MKHQFTSTLLLIFYLTANVGYSLNMHYMNGKLMDSSITNSATCTMECNMHSTNFENKHYAHSLQEHIEWTKENNQSNSGCSDHDIKIKIDDPQLDSKQNNIDLPFISILFIVNHFELVQQLEGNKLLLPITSIEKRTLSIPIYISYQRLIFYS